MKFVGSKNRISKYIAPILQKCLDNNNAAGYYEPFFGGGNMMDKIVHKNRWGSDIHEELIWMWKYLIERGEEGVKEFFPDFTIEEDVYLDVRDNKSEYPKWFVGFVGFHATFGSRYFEGYARGFKADKVTRRDIPAESIRNTIKQLPRLKGVHLNCCSYKDCNTSMRNFVVYCDPPYFGTELYKHNDIDVNFFWEWVRKLSKDNWVFVSEYVAPKDFSILWQKEVKTSLKIDEPENRVEKLFIYKNGRNI